MCSFLSIQPLNTSLCFKHLYSKQTLNFFFFFFPSCQHYLYYVHIGNSCGAPVVKAFSTKLSDLSPAGSVTVTGIAKHLPAGLT